LIPEFFQTTLVAFKYPSCPSQGIVAIQASLVVKAILRSEHTV